MKRLTVIALLTVAAMLASCMPPPASQGGFRSLDPASRIYAIQRAGENGDRSSIPYLIESLESDDPAERMWAIVALEKLTGERKGYRAHADLLDRQQAIARWREALARGDFKVPEKS